MTTAALSAPRTSSFARTLLPVWLVTAAWDAMCATALSVFGYHTTAGAVWQGVASVALGSAAPQDARAAVVAGLAIHCGVALTWSALFVGAARALPALRRAIATPGGALAVAAAYGPLIWLAMSLVVIPLATGRPPRFGFRWCVQVGAHIPFVTIPLVFTARRVLGVQPAPAITPATERAR
ncbi:MAG TPA: hypothetical protein VFK13_08685 [Gemmatimonadaceae bacterium]|nr:hypothetical protein [Gemmatimonadaceae bacterium]